MAGLMTWTRHWAPVIVVAWVLGAVLLAYAHHAIKTRYQARQRRLDQLIADEEARIDRLFTQASAERFHSGDLAHCDRCLIGRDDDYLPVVIPCPEHRPACTCTTYTDQETGRAVWITCGTCRPAGRHHRRADIVTATLAQLDEWRRAQ